MPRYLTICISIFALTSLTACINGTRVQQDYISLRDECRGMAEENYDFYSPKEGQQQSGALAVKDQNAILAKIFSDCMYMNGWTVAAPGAGKKRVPDDLIALNPVGQRPAASTRSAASVQQGQQQQQPAAAPQTYGGAAPVQRGNAPIYTGPPSTGTTYVAPSTPLPAGRQPVNAPR